jgi:hypothetical protein
MRWTGHIQRGNEKLIQDWPEEIKGNYHLGDLDIYGRIFKWILKKLVVNVGLYIVQNRVQWQVQV